MKKHPLPLSRPLLAALLALGLCAGPPVLAADGLGQFTTGLVAPADIQGGVVFGKNGEVIPLDAAGKPQSPCRLPQATPLKNDPLPACRIEAAGSSARTATANTTTETCTSYYIVYVNGVPIKIWLPPGCTPP